jgi:hypothetical protein
MSNFFTLPGDYVLNQVTLHAPGMASLFGIGKPEDTITLTIVLSVLLWMLACVTVWASVKFVRNTVRISDALVRTAWYRAVQGTGNVKTRIVCKLRQLFPHRRSADIQSTPELEFDDFDFTVLQAAADCGPGFTTSAPELASQYGLRPSQFQESLVKLQDRKMITSVIGSTDGFDNYRLTDYGAAYIRMWDQRQAS